MVCSYLIDYKEGEKYMKSKEILIIGGGIAGLAMLQFLRNTHHQVTLIEKAKQFRSEGAGIMLGINAMSLMQTLGLSEKILAHGIKLKEFCMIDSHGQLLGKSDSNYMYEHTGFPTVAIHRSLLHEILCSNLNQENIKLNTTVDTIKSTAGKTEVVFNDGQSKTFDLVIGADGIHSPTRKLCNISSNLRFSGYTCWRFVIDLADDVGYSGAEIWCKGKRFGIVPIGQNKFYCFATCNSSLDAAEYQNLSVRDFEQLFAGFGGMVQNILSHLSDNHVLIHNDIKDQKNICMVNDGIAFMGDAAHAATPNMGQGAGMAIEDAYRLFHALASSSTIADALADYDCKRTPRVKLIRDRSFTIGKVAQWESNLATSLRNRVLKLLPENGLTKNQIKFLLAY